jgi:serine/threonine protein phosphatase 1
MKPLHHKESIMSGITPVHYIGDVHGRADLLGQMLAFIRARSAAKGVEPVIHFLGDIVDRGPESCAALELVHETLQRHPGSLLHLGNHDQWFLQGVDTDGEFNDSDSWGMHGAYDTLASYTPTKDEKRAFAYIRKLYPHHVEMLRNARRWTENGPLFAAHAGVHPRYDLETMKKTDYLYLGGSDPFLWVRDPFLDNVDRDAMPVIHGHTIVGRTPVVTENRISIDTGAYATGRLTMCSVDPENRSLTFWQTDPETRSVVEVEPVRLDRGYGTIYDRLPALFDQWQPALAA